jgi:hypothetical protein
VTAFHSKGSSNALTRLSIDIMGGPSCRGSQSHLFTLKVCSRLMTPQPKGGPVVRKDAVFGFPIAVASWIDLLGYGSMIAEANFNPLHPRASEAMERLRHFHKIVAAHSARNFPTLVINDGAAAYRDLSLRSREPTYDFLVRTWNLFSEIKLSEEARGLPGARVVLATGFRMRGRRAGLDAVATHFKSVMRRYQAGDIGAEEAIREAAHIQQPFDIVPQLQGNFAFSKAYVAEASGKKGGLAGANLFVDLALFNMPMPASVVVGDTVTWVHEVLRMKASFAPLLASPSLKHIEGGPRELRDALQIAQHLTGNPNVLGELRAQARSYLAQNRRVRPLP